MKIRHEQIFNIVNFGDMEVMAIARGMRLYSRVLRFTRAHQDYKDCVSGYADSFEEESKRRGEPVNFEEVWKALWLPFGFRFRWLRRLRLEIAVWKNILTG